MKVLVLGATGTIGQATTAALVERGHTVVCLLRPRRGEKSIDPASSLSQRLKGSTIRWGDPCERSSLIQDGFAGEQFDAVISCLASRTGAPNDAWRVDYQAHLFALEAAQASGVKHFVLLSAICVQKPLLAFQHAKLAFEQALIQSGLNYSIVRPTAYFKSLSGQLRRVKNGKPFLLFGDGNQTACKPISDNDLAAFLAGCLDQPTRHYQILPIGGPGPAITPRQQGEELFRLLKKQPRFKSIPIAMMSFIIGLLTVLGRIFPSLADKAELARIGRYYATESMLVWDASKQSYDAEATPSYGTETLFDAYAKWVTEDGAPELGEHAIF